MFGSDKRDPINLPADKIRMKLSRESHVTWELLNRKFPLCNEDGGSPQRFERGSVAAAGEPRELFG